MNDLELLHHVDHTLLKPFATWEEIKQLCNEAIEYKTASVCVPPSYVNKIHTCYGERLTICTVVGFPLGYNTFAVKLAETKAALEHGADEIDMVINITDVKNRNFAEITAEIGAIRQVADGKVLKVIIETCYLTEEEKIAMCKAVTAAKADYIKTSTGFGTGGAVLADIELFKQHLGSKVKIKAAGGIKTIEEMKAFIAAGCERIGTSSAIKLMKEQRN